MATVRVSMKVCDVCGNTPAEKYTVGLPGDTVKRPDLCAEHAAPLEAFRGLEPSSKPRRQVMTPEEVAKQRRRAPRKRGQT